MGLLPEEVLSCPGTGGIFDEVFPEEDGGLLTGMPLSEETFSWWRLFFNIDLGFPELPLSKYLDSELRLAAFSFDSIWKLSAKPSLSGDTSVYSSFILGRSLPTLSVEGLGSASVGIASPLTAPGGITSCLQSFDDLV